MTRSPSSKGSSSSYQVSSPQYRDRGGSYPPNQYYYPNGSRQPPKYEMSEFTANAYMTSNGNKNGNSRVGPMVPTNGHKMSRTEEEEDEELDRGHWGSKAEFILSCIGFSVRFLLYRDYATVFENYSKCRIWIFELWQFPPIFVLLKMTCLVTLFDRKLQDFKNSPN